MKTKIRRTEANAGARIAEACRNGRESQNVTQRKKLKKRERKQKAWQWATKKGQTREMVVFREALENYAAQTFEGC